MNKTVKIILGIVLLILLVVVIKYFKDSNSEEIEEFTTEEPYFDTVKTKVVATGKLNPEEEIELKLNPLLSPQENAGKYYQKSKNEGKKIAFIEQQIAEHQKELEQAQDKLLEIQNTSDIKGLQQFEKGVKSSAEPKVRLPYKRFDWNGLEIRVGKSAKDNDELLRSYSSSHDLWFHAAGVSGSHVILRLSKNQQIGEDIIEKVAGLAAYYSKARKESLAKVVYTFRKFVRKPKGGAVGAVLIEKENSLLIEPSQEL